jgi:hypothetical protein
MNKATIIKAIIYIVGTIIIFAGPIDAIIKKLTGKDIFK